MSFSTIIANLSAKNQRESARQRETVEKGKCNGLRPSFLPTDIFPSSLISIPTSRLPLLGR